VIGIGEIEQNCSACKKEFNDDEEIKKDGIGFNEIKVENVIHENRCIRLCECGDARMGTRCCNCNIEGRAEMQHDIILLNCTFEM
jgi:protein-disulfide isomerase